MPGGLHLGQPFTVFVRLDGAFSFCAVFMGLRFPLVSHSVDSMQQSDQHKFECSMKAIELLIEQRNLAGLGERISQVPSSSFLHAPAFLFYMQIPSFAACCACSGVDLSTAGPPQSASAEFQDLGLSQRKSSNCFLELLCCACFLKLTFHR